MAAASPHILVAPMMRNMGETARMRPLAAALCAEGCAVTVLGRGTYASLFDGLDVPRAALPTDEIWMRPEPSAAADAPDRGGLDWIGETDLAAAVREETALLRDLRPDAVLTGFRPSLSVSTKVARIPLVWCLSAVVSDLFFLHRLATPPQAPFFRAGRLHRLVPRRLRQAMLCRFGWRLPLRMRAWNAATRRAGVPAFPSFLSVFRGDFNLMCDAAELYPEFGEPPPYYAFCGPLVPESAAPAPASLRDYRKRPGRPTVYFGMGSSGDPQMFRLCLEALAAADEFDVFASTLSVSGAADLPALPPHVTVERVYPVHEVLAVCDAAVVHGGHGTVYAAAFAGIPFVGIPMFSEQQYNLETLARRGGGEVLDRTRLAPARLLAALRRVLRDPACGERARRLRDILAPYRADPGRDPGRAGARLILDFLRHPERSYFRLSPHVRCYRSIS